MGIYVMTTFHFTPFPCQSSLIVVVVPWRLDDPQLSSARRLATPIVIDLSLSHHLCLCLSFSKRTAGTPLWTCHC